MARRAIGCCWLALVVGTWLQGASPAQAQEERIQFSLRDHGIVPVLFGPGVVITGSDDLYSWTAGLGVVGGSIHPPETIVDDGEFLWVVFTSDWGARDVVLYLSGWDNGGQSWLDAFGPDGSELAVGLDVDPSVIPNVAVSELVGPDPIGAFRVVTQPGKGILPARLDFVPVPEPYGAGSGLAVLAGLARRRR